MAIEFVAVCVDAIVSKDMKPSWPPTRGRGGRGTRGRGGHILAQLENKKLVADSSSSTDTGGFKINHPMYKEFMDFMKSKQSQDNTPPTYSTILMDEENIEVFDLNEKKEVILLLENNDLKWKDDPWQLMTRRRPK
ncbi:hypothetical protein R3W88_027144 [Solanum pinnatisectum]|uniref:Uncharacterized protein n=1 Tax=Solanum pinnatisectum TaxID=50273 RepID=A0AAV9LHQ3_9SOLN|nr:hypothetical protein R3W88_027144 [Solanum pinnatisectum]